MKLLKASLAAAAVLLQVQAAAAAPAVPAPTQLNANPIQVPFDPPLDATLRYRWEKTVQKDGKTDMSWSVSDYRFETIDDGYRLIVTPVSSGSNETDQATLAMMRRLDDLTRRPFVLRLDSYGAIVELEDADFYWSTIFKVLREELSSKDGKPLDETAQRIVGNVLGMMEEMPPESRLALLTEPVQPLVEFANTEFDSAAPTSASIESPSPFGGTINRDVTISVKGVDGPIASFVIRSSIPRAELTKLVNAVIAKFDALPAEKRSEAQQGIAALENFRQESAADYAVSMEDGMLSRFQSTETVEAGGKSKLNRKITTQSLERIE